MLTLKERRKNSKRKQIRSFLLGIRQYNLPLDIRILLTGYYLRIELGLQKGFEYVQRYKGDVLFGHFLNWGHKSFNYKLIVGYNVTLDHWNRLNTLIKLGMRKEDLLLLAVEKERPKIIRRLIELGTSVSYRKLIEKALFKDHPVIIKLLLDRANLGDPIYTGRVKNILDSAFSYCDLKVIKLLIKRGISLPPVVEEHSKDKLGKEVKHLLKATVINKYSRVFKWVIRKYRPCLYNIFRLVPKMLTCGRIDLLEYTAKKYKVDYSTILDDCISNIETYLYDAGDEEITSAMLKHVFQYSNKIVDMLKLVESVHGSIFIIEEISMILKWNSGDLAKFLSKVSDRARLEDDPDTEEKVRDKLEELKPRV